MLSGRATTARPPWHRLAITCCRNRFSTSRLGNTNCPCETPPAVGPAATSLGDEFRGWVTHARSRDPTAERPGRSRNRLSTGCPAARGPVHHRTPGAGPRFRPAAFCTTRSHTTTRSLSTPKIPVRCISPQPVRESVRAADWILRAILTRRPPKPKQGVVDLLAWNGIRQLQHEIRRPVQALCTPRFPARPKTTTPRNVSSRTPAATSLPAGLSISTCMYPVQQAPATNDG